MAPAIIPFKRDCISSGGRCTLQVLQATVSFESLVRYFDIKVIITFYNSCCPSSFIPFKQECISVGCRCTLQVCKPPLVLNPFPIVRHLGLNNFDNSWHLSSFLSSGTAYQQAADAPYRFCKPPLVLNPLSDSSTFRFLKKIILQNYFEYEQSRHSSAVEVFYGIGEIQYLLKWPKKLWRKQKIGWLGTGEQRTNILF